MPNREGLKIDKIGQLAGKLRTGEPSTISPKGRRVNQLIYSKRGNLRVLIKPTVKT